MSSGSAAPLRVGVLPPESSFVPFLASDLLAALEFGLAESGLHAELVVEFAGYNAEHGAVLSRIQSLLVRQRVACVIAPLNVSLVAKFGTHFQSHRVPLIALSMGEDPWFEAARNPYVFVNSYHLWRAAWMCGYVGARRFGPSAAMLVAMHESGYGLSFAFQLGLEAAGGSLARISVTHRTSSTESPSEAIAAVASHRPDFIWAAHSGKEAASLLVAYAASEWKGTIPVVGLPSLVDWHVRAAAGEHALGTYVVAPGSQHDNGDALATPLAQALGRPANPYATLAYESAHLVAAAFRSTGALPAPDEDVPARLHRAEFHGPRGLARLRDDAEPHTPFYLYRVTAGDRELEEIEVPPLLNEQCAVACKNLSKQGWVNPYLCA